MYIFLVSRMLTKIICWCSLLKKKKKIICWCWWYNWVSMISAEEGCSWDVINKSDIWEGVPSDGENESDKDDYVLVKQEDIMEGIASFMAAYLLSLKETKVGQCFCCFSFNCPILETWCLCTPVIGVHQIVTFCFLSFLIQIIFLAAWDFVISKQ